jgi:hypothetical protein
MKATLVTAVFVLALGGSAFAQSQGAATPAASMMNFKQACGADVQKLCSALPAPKDQRTCIRQNKSQLSSTCLTFLAEKKSENQAMKRQMTSPAPAAGGSGN